MKIYIDLTHLCFIKQLTERECKKVIDMKVKMIKKEIKREIKDNEMFLHISSKRLRVMSETDINKQCSFVKSNLEYLTHKYGAMVISNYERILQICEKHPDRYMFATSEKRTVCNSMGNIIDLNGVPQFISKKITTERYDYFIRGKDSLLPGISDKTFERMLSKSVLNIKEIGQYICTKRGIDYDKRMEQFNFKYKSFIKNNIEGVEDDILDKVIRYVEQHLTKKRKRN